MEQGNVGPSWDHLTSTFPGLLNNRCSLAGIWVHVPDIVWCPFVSKRFSSVAQLCATFCDPMDCSLPGLPVHHHSWSLLKLICTESVMPSKQFILCPHLLLLPSIFPSIRVFSNESALHIRWPKYWSFSSVSILPMNMQDWFPLGWTGWISLQSKGVSRVFTNTTVQKLQFSSFTLSTHMCGLLIPYHTQG